METLTFLFTDIEGSTALLGRVGHGVYEQVLAGHHAIIRSGLAAHGGREVDTQGDAFFAVFSSPAACLAAVIGMQQALRLVTGDFLEEALSIYRDLGDRPGQAHALGNLGIVRRLAGGWPGTGRVRPGTWRRHWSSPVTSATGAVR